MQLIIFGAPGVGKGTQAKILSAKLNIPHISTGDILREAIRTKTDLGLKAKVLMDKGELVPDEVISGVVKSVLLSGSENGFLLDGFPRTLHQAKLLDDILKEIGKNEPCLLVLSVDDDVIVERLSNRRTCANCGSIVSMVEITDENVCPVCHAEKTLIRRKDDEEKVIRNRLKIYKKTTRHVLNYYKRNPNAQITFIEGDKPVDEVTEDILNKLGKE